MEDSDEEEEEEDEEEESQRGMTLKTRTENTDWDEEEAEKDKGTEKGTASRRKTERQKVVLRTQELSQRFGTIRDTGKLERLVCSISGYPTPLPVPQLSCKHSIHRTWENKLLGCHSTV